jgi:hypothetical protein
MVFNPICNMKAAVSLYYSMCNDGKAHNSLSAIRGYWGCTRKEGNVFYPCLQRNGITQGTIKAIACPSLPIPWDCGCSIVFDVPNRTTL